MDEYTAGLELAIKILKRGYDAPSSDPYTSIFIDPSDGEAEGAYFSGCYNTEEWAVEQLKSELDKH